MTDEQAQTVLFKLLKWIEEHVGKDVPLDEIGVDFDLPYEIFSCADAAAWLREHLGPEHLGAK